MSDSYPKIHAKMTVGPTTIGKMLILRDNKEPRMLPVREYVISYLDENNVEYYKLRYCHMPRPITI